MTYRSIGLSTEQVVKDVFKQANIEAMIYSLPLGSVEAILYTTEHDEAIRAEERRKFAEWLEENSFKYIDSFWQGHSIGEALEDYEKEKR